MLIILKIVLKSEFNLISESRYTQKWILPKFLFFCLNSKSDRFQSMKKKIKKIHINKYKEN
ncbi:hypothetical protein BpHYR1_028112 [Brachionus plicatilis]|uniref:Uncharacterized protein n=1 Tax=Brachionus plicatilis TaxID=10195 RepID=A0A3M7RGQ0_BRAPC|nr:hypothetical protein BpHYR1_028112 [Brachionus plicatilis]